MTAVICSVCDGTPGRHDQARHQAFVNRNRAAWARRPTSGLGNGPSERARLTRENTRLRRELIEALRLVDRWRRVAMDNTTAELKR